ncbi:MAG: SMC family ATPase [Gemmatimonadetes bacterium]|nr:SMC family ATPase [Gemmatimonadota bacterium]
MKLIELRLQNFRQHVDTAIHFRPGLTGIIGPNGAGKSTLLEALAWAIYGSEAARGTNDTLRFARAGARSRVQVELRFGLAGHEYRVVRTLNNAEAFLDGSNVPVATTLGGVTRYLQGRLGMTRREFFNTYFTGQKELQFLATMGPADRGRFLSTVLGYERLRQAQDRARVRRSELRSEIDALRGGMPDPAGIRAAHAEARVKLAEAQGAFADAETARAEALEALSLIVPRWTEVQGRRDRHRDLSGAIESAERERDAARREMARIDQELARIGEAEREREALREQLAPLPGAVQEVERMVELARKHERRRALAEQAAEIDAELERQRERLEGLEKAPALLGKYATELSVAREESARVEREIDEKKTAWLCDRQDAETKLLAYRDRATELQEQIRRVRESGSEGICPTCGRPLGADFEKLLSELNEQWTLLVQDGKWLKSRRDQLEAKPAEVVALEEQGAELEKAIAEKARKHTRCESAVQELEAVGKERAERAERREELRRELESIPSGYDRAAHNAAEERLHVLRKVETRAAQLDETVRRREEWERERLGAQQREAAALLGGAQAATERETLGFSEAGFAKLRLEHDVASRRRHDADLQATVAKGELSNAVLYELTAARAEQQMEERLKEIALREVDHRHHNELDAAFSQLRGELNAQVRPELGEVASSFIAQLTDGRYTSLEIDDEYNICVLDEGEQKPVISGGEEDVANLVLRLSLSQMIAERAGHPLALLVLDEVFGSLDVARRDNVVQLLRRLEDRFEQVILITHIEGLRENLDQILHVSYDERTGSSMVREESFSRTDDSMPEDAAAD